MSKIFVSGYQEYISKKMRFDYASESHLLAYFDFFANNPYLSYEKSSVLIDDYYISFREYPYPSTSISPKINKNQPDKLRNKLENQKIFKKYGFDVLPSFHLVEECCSFDFPTIIKPIVGAGSIPKGNNLAYKYLEPRTEITKMPSFLAQKYVVDEMEGEYNQLYIEGFVNPNSETFISSAHEIKFQNGKWVGSLELSTEEQSFINENIINKIKQIVVDHSIKKCCFLLQLLRKPNTKIWYPTDWQFRLSYMSLFGRRVFNKQFTNDCVGFMTGQLPNVAKDDNYYYQGRYAIRSEMLTEAEFLVEDLGGVTVPVFVEKNTELKDVLFITTGKTFEEAKSKYKMIYDKLEQM